MYINRCRLESANCSNCEFYKQCFSGCLLYNLILPLENFSEVNLYVLDLYLFIFFLSHVNICERFLWLYTISPDFPRAICIKDIQLQCLFYGEGHLMIVTFFLVVYVANIKVVTFDFFLRKDPLFPGMCLG